MPPNPRYSWVLSGQCCSAAGVGGVSSSVWRLNLSGFIPPSVIANGASSSPVSSTPLAGQWVSTETSDGSAIVQLDSFRPTSPFRPHGSIGASGRVPADEAERPLAVHHAVRARRTARASGSGHPPAVIVQRFDRGLSELCCEIVRERTHLRHWVRTRGIDGVHIDRLQRVVGKDRTHLAALELRPAHPPRHHGNPEPRLHAGHHAIGGCDLHSAVDGNRGDGARAPKVPAAATQQPGPDNAIVPRQVRQRVRNAALR